MHRNNMNMAAPGVAHVLYVSNISMAPVSWINRKNIFWRKIAKYSLGSERIDYSDLTTYETCHLRKAQNFFSREPRPIPSGSLDEVFIDTMGKLDSAFNGHQYAVLLTDAKMFMW